MISLSPSPFSLALVDEWLGPYSFSLTTGVAVQEIGVCAGACRAKYAGVAITPLPCPDRCLVQMQSTRDDAVPLTQARLASRRRDSWSRADTKL